MLLILSNWSGIQDSNLQPHAPKARTLANCANPRFIVFKSTQKPTLANQPRLDVESRRVAPAGRQVPDGAAGGNRTHTLFESTRF